MTAAHDQSETRRYTLHYPAHGERESDPHYRDFHAFRKAHESTAVCAWAVRTGVADECLGGLELHHGHIEFALTNGVDLAMLEHQYPGISDPAAVGAWVESGENFVWYCAWHHRGHGGVHVAASSDFEASHFVRRFIA